MESKAVLPLPPGMVPSSSREDMTDLMEEVEEKEDPVLKEVISGMSACLVYKATIKKFVNALCRLLFSQLQSKGVETLQP